MSFPNQLSLLRIILAPIFLFFFLSDGGYDKILSLVIYFIATLTDWYDGILARKFGLISNFGIFIDPLADKILTSLAFFGFHKLGYMPLWMVVLIVVRDIAITVVRSYHEYKGHTMKTSFIAKAKTFIQMTYIFLIIVLVSLASLDIDETLKKVINDFLISDFNFCLMLIVTLLTVYTGISYFFEKRKIMKESYENN